LSFTLCILSGSKQSAFYLLPARFWELGAGVVLAILMSNQDSVPFWKGISNAVGTAGALLLCVPLLTV
jgi:peptidoglycan/LPS O-acetylase OafA/YrhL